MLYSAPLCLALTTSRHLIGFTHRLSTTLDTEESLDTANLLSILSSAFDAQSSDEGSNFGNNLQPNGSVTIKTEPMAQVPSLGIETSTYFSNLGFFVFISLLNRHNCDSLSRWYSWNYVIQLESSKAQLQLNTLNFSLE